MEKTVRLCLAFLIAIACACAQAPQPPVAEKSLIADLTEEELKAQVDRLLSLMASNNFRDREEATKNLRNLLKQSGKKKKVLAQYLNKRFEETQDTDTRLCLEPIIDQYLRPWKCFEKVYILQESGGWPVCAIAFSPDGKFVACGTFVPGRKPGEGKDVIRIWEVDTGRLAHTFEGHQNDIGSVTFGPDSRTLAAGGSDGQIRIWDTQTGRLIHTLRYEQAGYVGPFWVRSVAFSPDGKLLAAGHMCQGPLTIWNPSTGKLLYTLGKYEGGVVAPLAFSPNGKLLACAFQSVEMGESVEPASLPGRIDIWDPHTRKLAKTLEFSNRAPFIVFFPDNKLLAFAKDENGVRLWNVLTGEHIQTFEGDEAQTICSPAFHPDGEVFASGSGDHKIRFWSVQTGKCLHTLKTSLPVDSVAFSPDGTKLVSAAGGAVILWGVPDDK